jgi:hypothetical protein
LIDSTGAKAEGYRKGRDADMLQTLVIEITVSRICAPLVSDLLDQIPRIQPLSLVAANTRAYHAAIVTR